MLNKIQNIIDQFIPELEGKKFLLAVSGGLDSVVLTHIFHKLRLNFAVAHCNFHLRASESDGDEKFVRDLATKLDALYFTVDFDTKKFADEKGISIQMSARDLRYSWFKEIISKNKLDYIVTAHHKNDLIETFFINLIRGTGTEGLAGMKVVDKNIFRPLLSITKEEILNYANENNLQWREDSSNQNNEYLRNKLRLDILPLFKELNPSFDYTMGENIYRINEARLLYQDIIEEKVKTFLVKNEFGFQLNLKQLAKEKTPSLILYEILKNFGFNYSTVTDILSDHHAQAGAKFFSATYRVVDHRGTLLITRLAPKGIDLYTIDDFVDKIELPIPLKFQLLPAPIQIEPIKSLAYLDMESFTFPLTIRKWHEGDVFKPFGMNGRKKLSDFFIDQKFSLVEKENTWLLCSADKILWVIGHRLDDRFKVTDETKTALKVEFFA